MPWMNHSLDDPRTVWAAPHAVGRLLYLAERHFDPTRSDRVVLFSGTELTLKSAFGKTDAQRNDTVRRLRKYFRRIVYQTKDIALEHVHVAPMGLSWGYMISLVNDIEQKPLYPKWYDRGAALIDTIRIASESRLTDKSRYALATLSKVAAWLDSPGTLRNAITHMVNFPNDPILPTKTSSSVKSITLAWESRAKLRSWGQSRDAVLAGVDFLSLNVQAWWQELPKYRFLVNPMGSALQTAKTYEALLCLTVPIIVPVGYAIFDELIDLGFPLILIEAWENITLSNLKRWWAKMSPRLESFRSNCLTVDGYWGMYTGSIPYCS